MSFEIRALRDSCLVLSVAEANFGILDAQALITMIADIEAFDTADELISYFGPDAVVHEDDSISARVGDNYTATFIPTGLRFDRNPDGRVIWSSVSRLKLMEIKRCR